MKEYKFKMPLLKRRRQFPTTGVQKEFGENYESYKEDPFNIYKDWIPTNVNSRYYPTQLSNLLVRQRRNTVSKIIGEGILVIRDDQIGNILETSVPIGKGRVKIGPAIYWKNEKKKFREVWKYIKPNKKLERIFLSIVHGAIELEKEGIPYPEKKAVIEKSLEKIYNCINNIRSIYMHDILNIEKDLIAAGFKMLETDGVLQEINAYFGFIDEIDENNIIKALLRINNEEIALDFPLENVPPYLRYEGAGVCWVERVYSNNIKMGRFEPGGELKRECYPTSRSMSFL